jgi:predicted Zn-dependent peptidase
MERLKTEPVSAEDLQMVKTRAKADLIRSLGSNNGIAGALARYQTIHGDWRELFRSVDRIEKVSREDIQRVAKKTFVPTNRTVAMIVNDSAAAKNN